MGSDLSETAVSFETANKIVSGDMSWPLNNKPEGSTEHAQVANTSLAAG